MPSKWTASAYGAIGSEPQCPHGLVNQITLIKQRYPHLKFILSVGGWTDSGPFYEMAASEESRQTFARSCADFLKKISAVRWHLMRIKGQYVVEQRLAGAMFWDLSNDDGTLLDALRAGLGVARVP